ncbi:MAG TPA: hypothetical protein VGR94_02505 [Candidatus Acidoferrales bacterium]|nr:hypothetical protein [Candidatus Acidoferrales bacterium]
MAVALAAAVLCTPHFVYASTLDISVAQMFPKEVGEVGYLDVAAARQQPWFAVAEQSLLPTRFRKLEFFLSAAGLPVDTQVDSLAWGTLPVTKIHGGGLVGVAFGHFSPITVEDYFRQQNLPSAEFRGLRLLQIGGGEASNDLFLTFLDSETAVFGQRAAIEHLLAVHFQGDQNLAQNSDLYDLVQDARQSSLAWAVWNRDYSRAALQQLLPQAAQIPQAAALLGRIQSMEFDITNQGSLSAQSEIVCSSPADAVTLAALLQAGIAYREHDSTRGGSQPSSLFDSIRVTVNAERVEVEIPLSMDRLDSALRSGNLLNLLQ